MRAQGLHTTVWSGSSITWKPFVYLSSLTLKEEILLHSLMKLIINPTIQSSWYDSIIWTWATWAHHRYYQLTISRSYFINSEQVPFLVVFGCSSWAFMGSQGTLAPFYKPCSSHWLMTLVCPDRWMNLVFLHVLALWYALVTYPGCTPPCAQWHLG